MKSGEVGASKKKHYRQDIQGLRGIAVLLVVVFHTGLAFPGGFVGVDIFFVLSGFVITKVLLRELQRRGRINLKRFYERRFRRLLPAAALLMVVTVLMSVVFLSPAGTQQLTFRTAIAAALFSANLYIYRGGGYFDPDTELNPLMHMWSLSVEEQFYFVLPITVALVWMWASGRQKKQGDPLWWLVVIVGLAGLASLFLSWMTVSHPELFPFRAERFGFFFPLTRVWEFAAGVLLAMLGDQLRPLGRSVPLFWGVVGGALILFAALTFNEHTAFPGTAAMVPVLGTVLLIVAGEKSATVERVLSIRPLTWMGDLSYSWYLWHWPLIVFAQVIWPEAGVWLLVVVGAASLLPAWVSFRFVEEPIRRDRRIVGPRAWQLALGCSLSVVFIALVLHLGASKTGWGLEPPSDWEGMPIVRELPCDESFEAWVQQDCIFPAGAKDARNETVLLLGDSHAASASDGVVKAANALGYDVVIAWRSSCPFFRERAPNGDRGCLQWQRDAMALIDELRPQLVVLSSYVDRYTRAPYLVHEWFIEGPEGSLPATRETALDNWGSALEHTLDFLDARAIPTLVIGPTPYYVRNFTLDYSLWRPDLIPPKLSSEEVIKQQEEVLSVVKESCARSTEAQFFNPTPELCDEKGCSPFDGETWLYYDDNHLNASGSLKLAPALKEAMGRLVPGGGGG